MNNFVLNKSVRLWARKIFFKWPAINQIFRKHSLRFECKNFTGERSWKQHLWEVRETELSQRGSKYSSCSWITSFSQSHREFWSRDGFQSCPKWGKGAEPLHIPSPTPMDQSFDAGCAQVEGTTLSKAASLGWGQFLEWHLAISYWTPTIQQAKGMNASVLHEGLGSSPQCALYGLIHFLTRIAE